MIGQVGGNARWTIRRAIDTGLVGLSIGVIFSVVLLSASIIIHTQLPIALFGVLTQYQLIFICPLLLFFRVNIQPVVSTLGTHESENSTRHA